MSDEIRINTDSLRSYAGQLDSIQRQIYALNAEIRSFRYHTGKLWNVNTYGYEWTINPAKSYCVDTANEFESIERYLQGCDPEMYEGNTGWLAEITDRFKGEYNNTLEKIQDVIEVFKDVVLHRLDGVVELYDLAFSEQKKSNFDLTELFPGVGIFILGDKILNNECSKRLAKDFVNLFDGKGALRDKLDNLNDVFDDAKLPFSVYKDVQKYLLKNKDYSFPEPIKSSLAALDFYDNGLKVYEGVEDYINGFKNKDTSLMLSGSEKLLDVVGEVVEDTVENIPFAGTIISYGKNMVENTLESFTKYNNVKDAYKHIFIDSGIEVAEDVGEKVYGYAKLTAGVLGIDLEKQYENLSDKEGFDAVIDVNKKLISEMDFSWDGYKNGLNIMFGKIKEIF